jgi:hypothetical protein
MLEVQQSGLRWIYFDISRCTADPTRVCRHSLAGELLQTIGQPSLQMGQVWIWDVEQLGLSEDHPVP